MQINTDNFPIYALDYLEGRMSAEQQEQFESYLASSSEAAEQIALFEGALPTLTPRNESYPATEELLHAESAPLWRRLSSYGSGAVAASLLLGLFSWATRTLTPTSSPVAELTHESTQGATLEPNTPTEQSSEMIAEAVTAVKAVKSRKTATASKQSREIEAVAKSSVKGVERKLTAQAELPATTPATPATTSASATTTSPAPSTTDPVTSSTATELAASASQQAIASLAPSALTPSQRLLEESSAPQSATPATTPLGTKQSPSASTQSQEILAQASTPAQRASAPTEGTSELFAQQLSEIEAQNEQPTKRRSALMSTLRSLLPIKRYESESSSGVEIASILRIGTKSRADEPHTPQER